MILRAKEDKNHPLRKLDEAWLQALGVIWNETSEERHITELYEEIVQRLEQFT